MTQATFALISLGCPKNLVDSECMGAALHREGFHLVPEPEGASVVVVNTCGFIADAREESYAVIGEMAELRRRGATGGLIVAGCLAEREREALLQRFPEVDRVVGVFARDDVARAARELCDGGRLPRVVLHSAPHGPANEAERLRLTPKHIAYLKIAEGCNRLCSFCTIPSIRGPYVSKPLDQVVREAEQLAADGARELVLIAQDTSSYGRDVAGEPQLAELLKRLEAVESLRWIRLMYLYPAHITDALIRAVNSCEKVVPYLDLPLQHISDPVLRRMRRQVSRAETEALLDRLRGEIDDLVLRTTLIVGFPGETEPQFEELLEFVGRRQFERLGAFTYRNEPGTPAATLDGQWPDEVQRTRQRQIMARQQAIAFAWGDRQVGRTRDVLIDRRVAGEDNALIGRTWADAPEVDGAVYVTGEGLQPGQIAPCEIVARRGYDLIAVCEAPPR